MMIKWHIFVTIILIQLKSFHCNTIELSSYSKVAKNGQPNEEPPQKHIDRPTTKLHHSREGVINSDLWPSKTFNDTESDKSTSRSIDNSRPYPFPLNNVAFSSNKKPSNHRLSHEPRIIYASSPIQQVAQDRFVPHETTDHFIEKNNRNRFKLSSNIKESDRDGPSQVDASVSDYKPPSLAQTYAFPPNSDSLYPPPGGLQKPISVSSYLPPPAGPTNYPVFPGPIAPSKPVSMLNTQVDNSDFVDSMSTLDDMNDASNNDAGNNNNNPNGPIDDMKLIDKPPAEFMPNKKPNLPSFPFLNQNAHNQDHDDEHIHDHHQFYDHEPFSPYDDSLKHLHGFEQFPEVIIDDLHHHDFFDDHHHFHHMPAPLPPPPPPPAPTTTLPPPPPEPEEPEEQPRVKKYSYFYLSRSLWYIPLYFTVWFTFYVTWLILQSIGRHKVDLPNHLTNRRSIRDLSHKETVDKVNILTEFVMTQIDDFKEKYL